MRTARLGTAMALAMAAALGCNGSSNDAAKKDGSTDTRGGRDATGTGTDPGGGCNIGGNVVQAGRTITINCVVWTCQGNDIVTSSGALCADASITSSDTRVPNRDLAGAEPSRSDTGAAPDQSVSLDTTPDQAGRRDAVTSIDGSGDARVADAFVPDVYVPDVYVPDVYVPDVFIPDDLAPPVPDAYLGPDSALTCTSESGSKYYAGGGVCFPCGADLCVCDSNGVIVKSSACAPVDAQ
jgi:hypothetical protein